MINRNYGLSRKLGSALTLASAALLFDGCTTGDDYVPDEIDIPLSEKLPNIVFILSDDLGYGDISMTNGFNPGNSVVDTPNIDSIAARGFNFSNAYVAAPVCAPSRGGFFTSLYPASMGFESNGTSRDNFDRMGKNNMGNLLKEAGYSTALIGKWDLSGGGITGNGIISQLSNQNILPHARGFDYFYGIPGGTNSFYPINAPADAVHIVGSAIQIGGTLDPSTTGRNIREYGLSGSGYGPTDRYTQVSPQEHLTDAFTDKALHFIDAHANQENPFFLFLSHHAPHSPFQATKHYYDMYDSISDPTERIYAAMVHHMDVRIGDILEKLDDLGITDNTLIIFASDNGGVSTRANGTPGPASNGGLRDGKWTVFEGGIRIPFALSWPAVYQQENQIFDHPITLLDLLPTMLRAAGYSSASIRAMNFNGVDIHPWLSGTRNGPIHEILFWRYIADSLHEGTFMCAVRMGNMKYIFRRESSHVPGREYLFDLMSNRAEDDNFNLIDERIYLAQRMAIVSVLGTWEAAMLPLPAGTPRRK